MTTPKITEVNIKNLRGISNLTLQDTRTFNLLVGPSEVGKTSVLEGIFIGSAFSYVEGFVSVNQSRGAILNNTESHQRAFRSLFRNTTEKEIVIDAKIKKSALKYSCASKFVGMSADDEKNIPINGDAHKQLIDDSDVFGVAGRSTVTGDVEGACKGSLKLDGNNIVVSREKFKLRVKKPSPKTVGAEKSRSYAPISHFSFPGDRRLLNAAKSALIHKKEGEITRVLQKINPQIKKIEVIGEELFIDIGLPTMQPAHIAGNGVIDVIFTLGILSEPKMTTLLLDEIGYGLYYASLKNYLLKTLQFAKAEGKQVFATTHRKDMLIALAAAVEENKDLQEDVMCYVISRNKRGEPQAYPHNYKTLQNCVDNDVEIR